MRMLLSAAAVFGAVYAVAARPALSPVSSAPPSPVPIVIWHGLGDRFDAPGLLSLKEDLENRPELKGVFVHIIEVGEDGATDQRATFFGSANAQVEHVCAQLASLSNLTDPVLNPSRQFDALGFSQGGQLLRAVVERCGAIGADEDGNGEGVRMRRLVTVGSQHMGISALPPCPAGSSPFSPCRLMHLSLVREGLYSSWAQHNIVPAQYFRDSARIDEYLEGNEFLRDINNERVGDLQPYAEELSRSYGDAEPRNETYRKNFKQLDRFVMFRFSEDLTVVPPHSSHFTLPLRNDTTCAPPPAPPVPGCYATPLPWSALPLYTQDYIGLRALDEQGRVTRRACKGAHMEIRDKCWEGIVQALVDEGPEAVQDLEDEEEDDGEARFVLQL
ncbi:hypothetical protein Rhopal_004921-T1 [Rhodotorula paludigena]|uniref:Palmitoyl-protein thioesterase 1 n=1 Tax=Rhodotorula paludigena TaxID=86838 RepID=A0AAV5GH41_9BASI|nr:hypothetical protein Rhopal_004921-T1 [Rhodotorula paludigena]